MIQMIKLQFKLNSTFILETVNDQKRYELNAHCFWTCVYDELPGNKLNPIHGMHIIGIKPWCTIVIEKVWICEWRIDKKLS